VRAGATQEDEEGKFCYAAARVALWRRPRHRQPYASHFRPSAGLWQSIRWLSIRARKLSPASNCCLARLPMAVQQVSLPALPSPVPLQLHLLPFTVQYAGPAKVSTFFRPTSAGSGQTLEASFRGRLLKGQKIKASCVVLREDAQVDPPVWKAVEAMDELVYWRRESAPVPSDPLPRALAWSAVSTAVCSLRWPMLTQADPLARCS
jgi:hypothetical protein